MNSIFSHIGHADSLFFTIPETIYFRSLVNFPRDCDEIEIHSIEINYFDIKNIENLFILNGYYSVWKISMELLLQISKVLYQGDTIFIILPGGLISNRNLRGGISLKTSQFGFSCTTMDTFMKLHIKKIIYHNRRQKEFTPHYMRVFHELSFEKTNTIDIGPQQQCLLNGFFLLLYEDDWKRFDILLNNDSFQHWTKSLHTLFGTTYKSWRTSPDLLKKFVSNDLAEAIFVYLPKQTNTYWFPFHLGETCFSWNTNHFIKLPPQLKNFEIIFDQNISGKLILCGIREI